MTVVAATSAENATRGPGPFIGDMLIADDAPDFERLRWLELRAHTDANWGDQGDINPGVGPSREPNPPSPLWPPPGSHYVAPMRAYHPCGIER